MLSVLVRSFGLSVLTSLIALCAGSAFAFEAPLPETKSGTQARDSSAVIANRYFGLVSDRAAEMAAGPALAPARDLPAAFSGLDYDGYSKLRPRPEAALWHEAGEPFAVLPLPRGGIYAGEVRIHIVDVLGAESLGDIQPFVDFVDFAEASPQERAALGASGWRAITAPGVAGDGYEAAVFQGASYFRAVAQDMFYGVSARGLAVGAGTGAPEEFPRFTDFWIVRPLKGETTLHAVALLDSVSVAGAYHLTITPGAEMLIDVRAELYPRIDLAEVGVAPLSSMYLHGPADRGASRDWRPQVHDSDGLSIHAANGERVWRPLTNPGSVQVSAFAADNVRGFGLEQRARERGAYDDLEARYEKRPGVWIEPRGDWGAGEVRLLEIPTDSEYHDNVAAFWRPAAPWRAGEKAELDYRLIWSAAAPRDAALAQVVSTRIGERPGAPGLRHVVIDFASISETPVTDLSHDVWASAGAVQNIALTPDPETSGVRLTFDFDPQGAAVAELHAALAASSSPKTETWLLRWTHE
jgi:glucans biosynthesis protein